MFATLQFDDIKFCGKSIAYEVPKRKMQVKHLK